MRRIRSTALMIVGLLSSLPSSPQNKPIPGATTNTYRTVATRSLRMPEGWNESEMRVDSPILVASDLLVAVEQRSAAEAKLDHLVEDKDYPKLERELPSAKLDAAGRTYFEGPSTQSPHQ